MIVNAESQGSGVYSGKGDSCVTRMGGIIRATSIDELPQLINILKDEMSFIGPRPALTYHSWNYGEYTDEQKNLSCKTGNYRMGSGKWKKRSRVTEKNRIECVVCRKPVFSFEFEKFLYDYF